MRELEPSEFNKVTGGTAMLDYRVAYVRDGKIYDINGDVMGAHSPADPFTLGADGSLQPNPILAAASDAPISVIAFADSQTVVPYDESMGDGFYDTTGGEGFMFTGYDNNNNGVPDELEPFGYK